jgi:hypothetical protein
VALAAAIIIVLGALALLLHRRGGSERRRYESLLKDTLDRLVTAQEGFYYDSSHYARSLGALPTLKLPRGVHVEITATPRSWWGTATHDRLVGRRCVVWVVTPPPSLPEDLRALENETKPLCFDIVAPH